MTEQPIIQLRNVRFSYPGAEGAEALCGVSLSVSAGEYVCVLGGNGSGKSTLARLINALLVPVSGSVRVLDIDTTVQPERTLELRRQVAMVFQHPDDQMVTSIVADDVAFGPENLGTPHDEIARDVDAALDAVGIAAFAQADPAELSGGQCQRVAIAGALAMRPKILVLDEPAAMLDVAGRHAIQRIIGELRACGITIVHITHFMDDALSADRVIIMNRGRIAREGAPAKIFTEHEGLEALGLELPFSLRIADALRPAFPQLSPALDANGLADELARALRDRDGGATAHGGADSEPHPAAEMLAADEASPADEPSAAPAIEFDRVSFSYQDERHPHRRTGLMNRLGARPRKRMPRSADTLRDLSFSVPTGSLTALIGRTGSGKSTSAELACALKLPNTGAVRICGIDTADRSRRDEIRSSIGFVAQLPERQLFAETVFEDVAFGPRNLGLSDCDVEQRVRESLAAVGLTPTSELLEASPFALSGGQQRCVAIAGVLALRAPIIVLDEPMAGLDPRACKRMRALLRSLRDQGSTLLVITHDMNDVAELADHVVALDHGELVAGGMPEQIFAADRSRLPGVPDACMLAGALSQRGVRLSGLPLTEEAFAASVRNSCFTVAAGAESSSVPAECDCGQSAVDATSTRTATYGAEREVHCQAAQALGPIHALDPRFKLAATIIYMISCLMVATTPQLVLAGCVALAAVMLARVPLRRLLAQLRPIVFFLAITSLFNLFFVETGELICTLGPLAIHAGGVSAAVLYTLRFVFLLLIGSLLMLTTPTVALTDATERLLLPLERLGIPVSQGMLVLSIALRFVPTLSHDARAISNAQIARGAKLEGGRFLDRMRAFIPLAVPLFSAAIRHADNLAHAMDARCYTGRPGRTHYHELRFSWRRDGLAFACLASYLALLIALR